MMLKTQSRISDQIKLIWKVTGPMFLRKLSISSERSAAIPSVWFWEAIGQRSTTLFGLMEAGSSNDCPERHCRGICTTASSACALAQSMKDWSWETSGQRSTALITFMTTWLQLCMRIAKKDRNVETKEMSLSISSSISADSS